MSLKNPVTPPGIDPGTVRLVAQLLNHYATPRTCHYTEPNRSVGYRPTGFFKIYLRSGLPSGILLSGSVTKTLHAPHLSPIRATCPAGTILDMVARTMFGEVYRS
jgi:hypothetical protein